jgi:hypothetical protein
MAELREIKHQLTIISKKLDAIDGKLDAVISKLDAVVGNENANTRAILQELRTIEDQLVSSQTLTEEVAEEFLAFNVNKTFDLCRRDWAQHTSPDVTHEGSIAQHNYNDCLASFFTEAINES